MIVADASAIIDVLVDAPDRTAVMDRLFAHEESIYAPHLLDIEIAQALRRYARSGLIDAVRGAEALDDLAAFPITRYPHDVLLPRVWELRNNFSAYDATYISLSELLDATLVTRDAAFANFSGHYARVELV